MFYVTISFLTMFWCFFLASSDNCNKHVNEAVVFNLLFYLRKKNTNKTSKTKLFRKDSDLRTVTPTYSYTVHTGSNNVIKIKFSGVI